MPAITTKHLAEYLTPPVFTCQIETPFNGQVVALITPVTVAITTVPGEIIDHVTYYIDGVSVFTSFVFPYAFNWNTAIYPNGSHTLQAIATDSTNTTAASPIISAQILNVFTCTITAPINGSVSFGVMNATVSIVTVGNIVDHVDYYVNGLKVFTTSTGPYTFSWNSYLYFSGSNTLMAIAVDTLGNTAQSQDVIVYSGGAIQGLPAIELVKSPAGLVVGTAANSAFLLAVNPDKTLKPASPVSWRCTQVSPPIFLPSGL